jgi:hypothetical protein
MPLRMDSLIVVSLLSYCTNISFYLILKAKHIPAHNHPVIERLLIYRNVSRCIVILLMIDKMLRPISMFLGRIHRFAGAVFLASTVQEYLAIKKTIHIIQIHIISEQAMP